MPSRSAVSLLVGTLFVTLIAVPAFAGSFVDVLDSDVFSGDIEWLADQGITKGCNPPTNDHFCPTDNVTREQMAAFMVRALDLTDNGGGNTFTDDNGSIFEDDIAKLAAAGITKGCNPPTNDHFCPTDNVTREQMAAFLHRALDPPPTTVTGLIATLSGGSGEIDVSWDANPEPDVAGYKVWFSELPGAAKTLVPEPYFEGPATRPGDRWYIVDWPRNQTAGESCYQISAVDAAGQEGPRSVEDCFDPQPGPPGKVMNVTAGLAGGSAEVAVSWDPKSGDTHHYNAYFSELPGGPYSFVTSVDDDVRNRANRVFFVDFPRDLTVGKTCYVISAVDFNDKEGPTSDEACFDPFV
jgi:hypothetical protein